MCVLDCPSLTPNRDVASAHKNAIVYGTDLAPIQLPIVPSNASFYILDANESYWTWDNRFDFIHIRNMHGAIQNWDDSLRAAFRAQAPGGIVEMSDLTVHPAGLVNPDSVWCEWLQMLSAFNDVTGYSFGYYGEDYLRRHLQCAGYEPINSKRQKFHLKREMHVYEGRCLLRGLIEQMKGILTRAFELVHSSLKLHELLQRLEVELLIQGVQIEV